LLSWLTIMMTATPAMYPTRTGLEQVGQEAQPRQTTRHTDETDRHGQGTGKSRVPPLHHWFAFRAGVGQE